MTRRNLGSGDLGARPHHDREGRGPCDANAAIRDDRSDGGIDRRRDRGSVASGNAHHGQSESPRGRQREGLGQAQSGGPARSGSDRRVGHDRSGADSGGPAAHGNIRRRVPFRERQPVSIPCAQVGNLSLRYGNSPETAFSYGAYGMLLCGVLDDPALVTSSASLRSR
jgi:hypothetical protein